MFRSLILLLGLCAAICAQETDMDEPEATLNPWMTALTPPSTPIESSDMTTAQGCPRLIFRREWGSRYSCTDNLNTPVPEVIIHHTAGKACDSIASCSAEVRNIQAQHKRKSWCDIGYNFLIGNDGNVYEGRGWTKIGSHAKGHNSNSIGVAFMGNYRTHSPSRAARRAAKRLIDCGISKNYIRRNYVLKGHRGVNPIEDPGTMFHDTIKKWPHFRPGKH